LESFFQVKSSTVSSVASGKKKAEQVPQKALTSKKGKKK
jgi:hypothetical protein